MSEQILNTRHLIFTIICEIGKYPISFYGIKWRQLKAQAGSISAPWNHCIASVLIL